MVSVCLATYNGELYIYEQILSVLKQLKETDELIISDDFSEDSTIEIINSISDPRVKVVKSNGFNNHNFNFENALKYAQGKYIFLCDQDDIWLDNKVERCVSILKSGVNLVTTDCFLVDKELQIIRDSFFNDNLNRGGLMKNFLKNSFLGCCMAFDREVLSAALPFPKSIKSHDTWIGLVAEIVGSTYFLNEKYLLFRRHGRNLSDHNSNDTFITGKSPYSKNQIFRHRFILLINLIKRFLKIKLLR